MSFGCSPYGESHSVLEGGEWCSFPKVVGPIKLVLEVVHTKFTTSLALNLHELPFFLGCES